MSTQVACEKIAINDNSITSRSYTTDAIGQVTAISDLTFGSHIYEYDHNGFLTKADDTTYSYDKNGNITKIGDKVLTYDSTKKDRLMSFDGKAITYDTYNPFNVASYNGKQFTYEGRRLVKIILSSGYIDYKYNDQGLRTLKKDYRGVSTDFEYDGDKLIYQRDYNARLDFLYDENGELYGFIKDSQDKYFYVRDCLKNILGIVDISGNLVVKYSYDAYGKCTVVSDSTTSKVGTINPFRFKGYYLDTETGFYYCNSRYYVPDWGRWLTADSIQYMNPNSVNGMNLYAYCNPIRLMCSFVSTNDKRCIPFATATNLESGEYSSVLNTVLLSNSLNRGIFFEREKITGLYYKTSIRSQIGFTKQKLDVGIYGKTSFLNGSGTVGIDLKHIGLAVNVVEDVGCIVAMGGLVIDPTKNTYFIGLKAKASALSARGGIEFSFLGIKIEVGISGEIGGIGAELCLGYKDGKIYFGGGGAFGVGLEVYFRVGLK